MRVTPATSAAARATCSISSRRIGTLDETVPLVGVNQTKQDKRTVGLQRRGIRMCARQDSHDRGNTGGDDVAPGLFVVRAVAVAVHDLQRTIEQPRIPSTTVARALLDCGKLVMRQRLAEAAEEARRRGLLLTHEFEDVRSYQESPT